MLQGSEWVTTGKNKFNIKPNLKQMLIKLKQLDAMQCSASFDRDCPPNVSVDAKIELWQMDNKKQQQQQGKMVVGEYRRNCCCLKHKHG